MYKTGLKQLIKWVWDSKKPYQKPLTDEDRKESNKVSALKHEVKFYKDIIEDREEYIASISRELKGYREENKTERMIKLGAKFFGVDLDGNPTSPPKRIQQVPDEPSDEEIKEYILAIPSQTADFIKSKSDEELLKLFSEKAPELKEKSLNKALTIFRNKYGR